MRTEQEIIADISQFTPASGNWFPLEVLLEELWAVGVSDHLLPALFSVFERFPDDDGAGVFWSIVHGVEHLDLPYEAVLRSSLARQHSTMGALMLKRLENT